MNTNKRTICNTFHKMIKSLVDEESIEDVEPPNLVGEKNDELFDFVLEYFEVEQSIEDEEPPNLIVVEKKDELFDFVLEYFAANYEEKQEVSSLEPFLSESEFLDRMDDILAKVTDDNMDNLADIVADWIL